MYAHIDTRREGEEMPEGFIAVHATGRKRLSHSVFRVLEFPSATIFTAARCSTEGNTQPVQPGPSSLR